MPENNLIIKTKIFKELINQEKKNKIINSPIRSRLPIQLLLRVH